MQSGAAAFDNYGTATPITYSAQYTQTTGAQINWTGTGFTQYRTSQLIGSGASMAISFSAEL